MANRRSASTWERLASGRGSVIEMGRLSCKYHPRVPARWRCPGCEVDLCAQCTKKPERARVPPTCLKCAGDLDSLGAGNSIPPFWERIPAFFLYPAKADSLLYLGMLCVLSLVAVVPIWGPLVYLMISYGIFKYGYLILSHTARGNLAPPEVIGPALAATNDLPLKQMVVFGLMFGLVYGAATVGTPLAIIALLFVLFSVPASTMSMAINGSIARAVNPVALAQIMQRIGLPYIILYVFLLLLSGASALVQEALSAVLHPWLVIMATTFASAYFTVIMFNMMGYVVYQYHEPLGFEDVREFDSTSGESPIAAARPPADPFEAELNVLMNEGQIEEARRRLQIRVGGFGSTPADHGRYHKVLQLCRDRVESSRHGQDYIRVLANLGDWSKAVEVYGECVALEREFCSSDGGLAARLAEHAHAMGKYDLALRMLDKFGQRFPRHPKIPQAYLLAAKLLCEHKGEDAKAKKILDHLLGTYPEHELAPEVAAYRDIVERLQDGAKTLTTAGAG